MIIVLWLPMRFASTVLPLSVLSVLAAAPSAFAQTATPTPLPALPPNAPDSPAPPPGAPIAPGPETSTTAPAPPPSPADATPAANPSAPVGIGARPEMPPNGWRLRLRHDGFYLAASSGVGLVGVWGSGPNGSASIAGFGSSSAFAIGGSLAPGLVLAGVIQGGTTSGTFHGGPAIQATTMHVVNGQPQTTSSTLSGHASGSIFLIGAQIDWYPHPEDGWHAGAAIGLGGASVTDDAGNTSTGGSIAGSLFGGYQWWLG
ncbi:MAG TPA: hypothetical protein VK841_12645, partial [Polyangiaceae bacterium]|nr:hypothetical protein [Polyangiaceae bacterium]